MQMLLNGSRIMFSWEVKTNNSGAGTVFDLRLDLYEDCKWKCVEITVTTKENEHQGEEVIVVEAKGSWCLVSEIELTILNLKQDEVPSDQSGDVERRSCKTFWDQYISFWVRGFVENPTSRCKSQGGKSTDNLLYPLQLRYNELTEPKSIKVPASFSCRSVKD